MLRLDVMVRNEPNLKRVIDFCVTYCLSKFASTQNIQKIIIIKLLNKARNHQINKLVCMTHYQFEDNFLHKKV